MAISEDNQTTRKGWLGRAVGKHISVEDENLTHQLGQIETAIANDDLDTALNLISKLPKAGQNAAQSWVSMAQTQIGENP